MSYSATLECGSELSFPHPEAVPPVGDPFPCLRHGFCTVTAASRTTRPDVSPETAEMVREYVAEHPGATQPEIRKHTGIDTRSFNTRPVQRLLRSEDSGQRRFYVAPDASASAPADQRLIEYVRAHPGCTRSEIRDETGITFYFVNKAEQRGILQSDSGWGRRYYAAA